MIILIHSCKRNEEVAVTLLKYFSTCVCVCGCGCRTRDGTKVAYRIRHQPSPPRAIQPDNDRFWLLLGYIALVEGFGDQGKENNSDPELVETVDRISRPFSRIRWNLVLRDDNKMILGRVVAFLWNPPCSTILEMWAGTGNSFGKFRSTSRYWRERIGKELLSIRIIESMM